MNVVTISYHIENTKSRDVEDADPDFIFNGSYSLLLNDDLPEKSGSGYVIADSLTLFVRKVKNKIAVNEIT